MKGLLAALPWMVVVRTNVIAALDHLDPKTTHLFQLASPEHFAKALPEKYQPPTKANSDAGLPRNVWVGMNVYNEEDAIEARGLLDIRARIRWIYLDAFIGKTKGLTWLFAAWRCPNCGHRGLAPRPKLCPHAKVLCGDVKLEPQIHWLITERGFNHQVVTTAKQYGLLVWPNEVPKLREEMA